MFRKKKRKVIAAFVCPNCGAVIPANRDLAAASRACPECGSDEETGWSEEWYPDDSEPDEEEHEGDARRKEIVKKVLKVGFSLAGALAIAAFIAVQIPRYGLLIGLAVIAAIVVALVVFRERPPSEKRTARELERELLAMSGRDPARVERLVMYERTRKPDASRAELLERAIGRLDRDRSR
ncbi:MAG: hypothetical protein JXD23_10980 [Spirochaetales bacterium]|nr:hypothetical protein [Spirochaetales bacterium]